MDPVLLVVGDHDPAPLRTVLGDSATVTVAARPERSELDRALNSLGGARLVLAADDAGVGAVVGRLLRRDALGSTPVALLPVRGPGLLRERLGIPTDLAAAAKLALTGVPTPQGLVRDDHGGVTLGVSQLVPLTGSTLGMLAYVDEDELVNAPVRSLTVTPGPAGLTAAVDLPRRLRRTRTLAGRAVTVSCEEARLLLDGMPRGQAQTRCTWWFEPDRWQVITG